VVSSPTCSRAEHLAGAGFQRWGCRNSSPTARPLDGNSSPGPFCPRGLEHEEIARRPIGWLPHGAGEWICQTSAGKYRLLHEDGWHVRGVGSTANGFHSDDDRLRVVLDEADAHLSE
jgi:hypothetical protein